MSTVKYYRDLLQQDARIEAFRRAIDATVRPGDVVLDVGTGLGTFAMFAADAGAARVFAVDGDPIVHLGHALARLNDYADRVTFVRGWLPYLEIPERANVIVIEDFSPRLMDVRMKSLLTDLCRDYAQPDARFVPRAAHFSVAPVSAAPLWDQVTSVGQGEIRHGLDWSLSREYVTNAAHAVEIASNMLAAPAVRFEAIELGDPDTWRVSGDAKWHFDAPQVIHGLALWFDLELTPGMRLSNAPGAQPGSWGHLFLPIDPPLEVASAAALSARLGTKRGALWWNVGTGKAVRRAHEFRSMPASLDDVVVAAPDYVPLLGKQGELERRVLDLVNGRRSVREIAADGEIASQLGAAADAERVVARILRERIVRHRNGSGPGGDT